MMAKPPNLTRKYFRKEGVVVKHPGLNQTIKVERLPILALGTMKAVTGGFKPFRPVINLKVVDAAHPGREVAEFEPPIELRVRYDEEDLAQAKKEGKDLWLGFWDGKEWIRFTNEKHQFELVPDRYKKLVGWGVVRISRWADPTKAWGT
jgi:hypothetical protein